MGSGQKQKLGNRIKTSWYLYWMNYGEWDQCLGMQKGKGRGGLLLLLMSTTSSNESFFSFLFNSLPCFLPVRHSPPTL
ncbi:hypothetical protein I7I48_02839 [Histoplasma ohiense]|nr:hypothetical protein I7I48_02839 [Histoplasma ohiense (nom. inval.)]